MRRVLVLTLLALASAAVARGQTGAPPAAGPPGYVVWPEARLKEASDRLEQKIGRERMVFETIGNWPGHSVYLVLRGATSDPEFHETESDLYIARRGRATLVIGGRLVNERALPRRQRRGSSIEGGRERPLAPGDVVHVPEAVPHQLLIEPGQRFMYILVKFDEEPLSR